MKQAWHLEGGVMTMGGDHADRGCGAPPAMLDPEHGHPA